MMQYNIISGTDLPDFIEDVNVAISPEEGWQSSGNVIIITDGADFYYFQVVTKED